MQNTFDKNKMSTTKILAMYLPQYYEFEQNNEWWGQGFTEWTNVRSSKPFFKNHRQPRIPLDKNYYCLLNPDSIRWQARLAREHSIDGFCIYHYWFEGIQMMEKPPEILLENKDIDIEFCFSWANHTWTKAPGRKDKKILIKQGYGGSDDWIKHFEYLNRFFSDGRYIKIDNKPVLVLYNTIDIDCWDEMSGVWNDLAKREGWAGIYYISTLKSSADIGVAKRMGLDAQFEYQPTFGVRRDGYKLDYGFWYHFKYNVLSLKVYNHITRFNYDRVWRSIEKKEYKGTIKTFLGAFNEWDTTIRWGKKGSVLMGANPKKFEQYMIRQLAKSQDRGNEFLFLTAWNEWSEGAYMEPDKDYGYGYLDAASRAIKTVRMMGIWNGK